MDGIRSPASNVSSAGSSPRNLKISFSGDEHISDTETASNSKKREAPGKSPSRMHKEHTSQELHVLSSNKSERRRSPAPKEKGHKKNKPPNVIAAPVGQEDASTSSVISPEIGFMGGKVEVSVTFYISHYF